MRPRGIPARPTAMLAVVVAVLAPGTAGAAWSEPATVCTGCTAGDGLADFAQAASGAAVAAWHGGNGTYASYRRPGDSGFGTPFVVASGGEPRFVRAAIGQDGTAAVATWIPASGEGVVARRAAGDATWTPVAAPGGSTDVHIAVGAGGDVVAGTWSAPPAGPRSLETHRLAGGAGSWSDPTTIVTLAPPYVAQEGIGLWGNGRGDFAAGWTFVGADQSMPQAFASSSADGASWTTPAPIGAPPSRLDRIGIDGMGNALATTVGAQGWYRSPLDDAWRGPEPVSAGEARAIAFDAVGNAALVGVSPGTSGVRWGARDAATGEYELLALSTPEQVALAVAPGGEVLRLSRLGTAISSRSTSAVTAEETARPQQVPSPGAAIIGAGLDRAGLGTAVYSTASGDVEVSTLPAGTGGTVELTTTQLFTNQRISQAAVLRSNGALAALDAGLPASAFRDRGLAAEAFGAGVTLTGTRMPAQPSNALGYEVPIPSRASVAGGEVELTQRQLRINQRISQAAVRRSNAVRERLREGLTSAQIGEGAITSTKLQPGLGFGPLGQGAPGRPIVVPGGGGGTGRIASTEAQLLVNQRIAQAAVRRSNLNIAILESGLTQDAVAPGGIAPRNVAP